MLRIHTIAIAATLAVGAVGALQGSAHAQRAPDMATLDRGDGISKIALDAGMSFVEYPYDLALRLELYGQYVTRSGIGIYGSLPLTASFGAPSDDEDPVPPDAIANDAASISNVELGGLYVITKSQMLSFVFRLGISTPTATDGRDERETRFAGVMPRSTDIVNITGNWYARLGFSPLIYADRLFLRFDLGFDIAFEETDPHVLRFNLGGGVDLGPVALSLELANSVSFFDGNEDFVDVLALTARFMGERFQPYVAIGAPLDSTRDAIQLFIAAGLQFVP
jgi:hypothetical protein